MKPTLPWIFLLLLQITAWAQPSGPGEAQFKEAQEYFYGLGKPYNPDKAFQLYREAANAGHAIAMNALGNMYAGGVGVAVDVKTALSWYEKSGDAGCALGYVNLAMFYRNGDAVPQDFTRAALNYKKGAALGNDFSKNSLAYFYFKGLGVPQSYANAFTLYKELAEKGNVNAQYFTGLCYRNGYGTAPDAVQAREWLSKAAEKNDRQALHELNQEPLPENSSLVSPALQNKLGTLENYHEDFVAAKTNNIGGTYTGYAVYFDFSKKYVHEIVPLTLTLQQKGDSYEGLWTESTNLSASLKAAFYNNTLSFDSSSKYIRHNYYSYRDAEPYRFNSAALSVKYFNDSIYLCGDVQFYSTLRHEPGQPMYIVLHRKALENESGLAENRFQLSVYPNPTVSTLRASFTLSKGNNVLLELLSPDGKTLQRIDGKTMPAGTYSRSFDVDRLAAGTYMIRMSTGNTTQTKAFVKR